MGGHPWLIKQAFTCLQDGRSDLARLLKLAPTEAGIYSNHLLELLAILQYNPSLETAYQQIINSEEAVAVTAKVGFKLHSLGLVKRDGNDCFPSYELYRQYFKQRLKTLNIEH